MREPPLPVQRRLALRTAHPNQGIAARVKHRNDIDGILRFSKHQNVGETPKRCAARVFGGRRKLLGILSDPGNRCAQGLPKLRHNMRRVSIVPADGLGEVGPRRLRKKELGHLS